MCIAIFKPAAESISDEILKTCYQNNSDGCGFAYVNTDNNGVKKIIVKKTMDFEVFLRQYHRAVRVAPDSAFLIHFRIRTHGTTDVFNCHPFMVDDNHVFVHNGIIRGMRYDAKKSDTQMFNEDYLQQLPDGWMFSNGITKLIENTIDFNKIVVMDIDENVNIYNEKKGEWSNRVWYSNNGYKPRSYVRQGSTTGVYRGPGSTAHHNRLQSQQQQANRKNTQTASTPIKGSLTDGTTNTVIKLPAGKAASETRNKISEESLISCDGCGTFHQVKDFNLYYEMNVCNAYCHECKRKLIDLKGEITSIEISARIYVDYWWYEKNIMSPRSCDSVFFAAWVNPWEYNDGNTYNDEYDHYGQYNGF